MKNLTLFTLIVILFNACSNDDDITSKVATVEFKINQVSDSETCYLAVEAEDVTIDWGDGLSDTYKNILFEKALDNGDSRLNVIQHEYKSPQKTYVVKILARSMTKLAIYSSDRNMTDFVFSKCDYLKYLKLNDITGTTELNLNGCTSLEELDVENMDISKIEVSKCTNIHKMKVADCTNLTSIDLSNNIKLRDLRCHNNSLKNLDLTGNKELTSLYCRQNELTSLNISNCTKLVFIDCYKNQLKSIDLSKNPDLLSFIASDNKLTSLEFKNMPRLLKVTVQKNELTSLTFNETPNIDEVDVQFNLFDENSINTLFSKLPQKERAFIYVRNNQGASTCNKSIASNKGWTVVNN